MWKDQKKSQNSGIIRRKKMHTCHLVTLEVVPLCTYICLLQSPPIAVRISESPYSVQLWDLLPCSVERLLQKKFPSLPRIEPWLSSMYPITFFMEAILLCILATKPHLLSLTQHRFFFFFNSVSYPYMYATCFGLYLGPQACQYKNHTKVTPQLSADKHRSTTTIISILAHNFTNWIQRRIL